MSDTAGPTHIDQSGFDTDLIAFATLVIGGAAFAALDDAAPTGMSTTDSVWRTVAGALIVVCAAYAPPVVWVAAAVAAAVSSGEPVLLVIGAITIVVAAVSAYAKPDLLSSGALVGLGVSLICFRLPHTQFIGASTLAAVAIVAIVVVAAWYWGPLWLGTVLAVGFATLTVTGIAGIGILGLTILDARGDLSEATDLAERSADLFREGDEDGAERVLAEAVDTLAGVQQSTDSRWVNLTRFVPVLSQHTTAVQTVTAAGTDTAAAALVVLEDLDRGALTITGGAVDLAAVDRIAPSISALAATSDKSTRDVQAIADAWLAPPAQRAIDDAFIEIEDLASAAKRAADAVELAPDMLGADGPRTHLVLFATPAELRGSVGLIGNWATLEAVDGKLSLSAVGRAEELVVELERLDIELTEPLGYVDTYGPNSPQTQFHDITLSPDFPDVGLVAAQLFEHATGISVDTVMLADPEAVAALLALTGQIQVGDQTTTAANARDFLLVNQYSTFGDEVDRVRFLEQLLQLTFARLFTIDFPDPWDLDEVFHDVIAEDRLVISSTRPNEQLLLEGLGLGGEFPERARPGDDLVAMVTQNGGQNKIDAFLERDLRYEATIDEETSRIDATVTIELTNAVPDLALPDAIVGSNDQGLPPGTNRLTLVVYSPHTLVGATIDGAEEGFQIEPEFGVLSFRRTIDIAADQTVVVVFTLEGEIDTTDGYRLLVPAQPTVIPDHLEVTVGGLLREAMVTSADQTFG